VLQGLSTILMRCAHLSPVVLFFLDSLGLLHLAFAHAFAMRSRVHINQSLNVKHEPLTLIPPQFELPLPPLQPAVFMPPMRELPPPSLDLFDLDQEFATEKSRLAQLTNKCTSEADLDYFVRESGSILGVLDAIEKQRDAAGELRATTSFAFGKHELVSKQILFQVLKACVQFKKMDAGQ
jgi:intraflagellar transport protein 52